MANHNYQPLLSYIINLILPNSREHLERVSIEAAVLGIAVGLHKDYLKGLEFAVKVHDIGMIIVPQYIRDKSGELSFYERSVMEKHPTTSSNILLTIKDIYPDTIGIVLTHHENYDGSGYPNKIKAEEIPVGARVLRIVDTYDALTHQRNYRPTYRKEVALRIMEENIRMYDPKIFDMFQSIKRR